MTLNQTAIYLDHAATTPVRPEVVEAMLPYLNERAGNPSSSHGWGRSARVALEEARERLAAVLGAERSEIVFTGSGTEADNLAVLGRWRAAREHSPHAMVVCSAIEHKAVLASVGAAAAEGAEAVVIAVDEAGRVLEGALDEAIVRGAAVVSVMWGNNEIGTLQPVERIGALCRERRVPFHSDAVQAFGRVAVRVDRTPVDLLSLSAHKIGGPKGVGALFVRGGVQLAPLLHGGSQEGGLRAGTSNVAGAVALATAAELAVAELASEAERLSTLRDRLESALLTQVDGAEINGGGAEINGGGAEINGGGAARLPQTLNVWIPGVPGEAMLMALDLEGLAVSGGSACQSGAAAPSHVLTAIGRATSSDAEGAAIRFSLGRTTTDTEIDRAIQIVPRVVTRVRELAGAFA